MTPEQNLHTAIGQLAYAIAHSDGAIQKKERQKFQDIVAAELRCKDYDFNVSDIVFQILEKYKFVDSQTAYDWAMKEIRINSHYLSPAMKETFIKVIGKVAKSLPPITREEMNILELFKKNIARIHGDPVYYESA